MDIVITITQKTAEQLHKILAEMDWEKKDLAILCVFLIRNALRQIESLESLHQVYDTSKPIENQKDV